MQLNLLEQAELCGCAFLAVEKQGYFDGYRREVTWGFSVRVCAGMCKIL